MKTADWIRAAPNEMPSLLGPFLLQITRLFAHMPIAHKRAGQIKRCKRQSLLMPRDRPRIATFDRQIVTIGADIARCSFATSDVYGAHIR